jgi:hypothetical protein
MMRKLALGGLLALGLMVLTAETANAQYVVRSGGYYGGGFHTVPVVRTNTWVNNGWGFGGYPGWYGRPIVQPSIGWGAPVWGGGWGPGWGGWGYPTWGGGWGGGWGRPAVGVGFNFIFR